MSRFQCRFVQWSLGFMAVYIPVFCASLLVLNSHVSEWAGVTPDDLLPLLLPLHCLGIVLMAAALILTSRDLHFRHFSDRNDRLKWTLLIVFTGGIGWIAYLRKYVLNSHSDASYEQSVDHVRGDG